MGHPADGILRRYLDEPAAVSDSERAHMSTCSRCTGGLGRAGADRDAVARALGATARMVDPRMVDDARTSPDADPDLDLDLAWAALSARLADQVAAPAAAGSAAAESAAAGSAARRRRFVRHPATAAVAAGLVLLGGTAAAAAADWLPIFRTEQVAPVAISAQDLASMAPLAQLQSLSAYGELSISGHPGASIGSPSVASTGLTDVPDAATAAARTGLTVPTVGTLPTGVQGAPAYQVLDKQSFTFTFSAAKAAGAAAAGGGTLPPLPAGLDGAQLRVEAGPFIAIEWKQSSGLPTLVVVREKAPTAAIQGASLPVVRDYLLSIPGIPPGLAAQLKAVTGNGTTLPIPVPADLVTSSQASVGDAEATVLEYNGGTATAAIWATHGEVDVVLGPLSKGEVLAVARGLG